MPRLTATYQHPLATRWSAAGGPWHGGSLDDLLDGSGGPELEARIDAVAGGLLAADVEPGAAVAWQLPNGPDAIALYRACWRLGAVAVPVHYRAGPAEVDDLLARVDPRVFVGQPGDVPTGAPVPRGGRPAPVDPASLAVALATSGTSGRPKLVLHTHRALSHKTRVMADVHQLGRSDATILAAPLAHISGLLNGVLLAHCGVRAIPMAAWDPDEALTLIRRERVTFMIGPPTFFVSLMDARTFSPAAVASLRQVSCGGAGVTPAFVREASAAFDCRVKRTYGSTEAPTITTSTLDDDPERAAETDGRPVGEAEVRLADGELWVRGPELFAGYDDPAATEAAFDADGWFRTGDVGTIDADGWLTITGRLADLIIRGGENVAPAEVEAVLEAHPTVRHAAVVGEPDRRLGERVCAFVVADDGFDLEECRRWFEAQGVTRFKWPERVERLAALPLLPAGKADREALRALLGSDG